MISDRNRKQVADDEFRELARDLNSFLDRITHVIQDLSDVLANVLVVTRRLTQVHDQMAHQFKKIDAGDGAEPLGATS